jgi:hypothetical protein
MIAVQTRGRMGNQMFQFAFAHAAARRLGTTHVCEPLELQRAFHLGRYGHAAVRQWRFWPRGRRLLFFPRNALYVEDHVAPDAVLAGLTNDTRYTGYFQSEQWFAGYEDDVRTLFRLRAEHQNAVDRAREPLGRYACVHVRRGDYATYRGGSILPAAFFEDCLARLPAVDELLLLSDDVPGARAAVPALRDARVVDGSDITDFGLLTYASAIVASASSFAWWGAWCNTVPDAQILVPRYWLGWSEGREFPRAVMPERWTQVAVPDAREPTAAG